MHISNLHLELASKSLSLPYFCSYYSDRGCPNIFLIHLPDLLICIITGSTTIVLADSRTKDLLSALLFTKKQFVPSIQLQNHNNVFKGLIFFT